MSEPTKERLKDEVTKQLSIARTALAIALTALNEANEDGQLDYCTDPAIGDIVDIVHKKAVIINNKWYQKRR